MKNLFFFIFIIVLISIILDNTNSKYFQCIFIKANPCLEQFCSNTYGTSDFIQIEQDAHGNLTNFKTQPMVEIIRFYKSQFTQPISVDNDWIKKNKWKKQLTSVQMRTFLMYLVEQLNVIGQNLFKHFKIKIKLEQHIKSFIIYTNSFCTLKSVICLKYITFNRYNKIIDDNDVKVQFMIKGNFKLDDKTFFLTTMNVIMFTVVGIMQPTTVPAHRIYPQHAFIKNSFSPLIRNVNFINQVEIPSMKAFQYKKIKELQTAKEKEKQIAIHIVKDNAVKKAIMMAKQAAEKKSLEQSLHQNTIMSNSGHLNSSKNGTQIVKEYIDDIPEQSRNIIRYLENVEKYMSTKHDSLTRDNLKQIIEKRMIEQQTLPQWLEQKTNDNTVDNVDIIENIMAMESRGGGQKPHNNNDETNAIDSLDILLHDVATLETHIIIDKIIIINPQYHTNLMNAIHVQIPSRYESVQNGFIDRVYNDIKTAPSQELLKYKSIYSKSIYNELFNRYVQDNVERLESITDIDVLLQKIESIINHSSVTYIDIEIINHLDEHIISLMIPLPDTRQRTLTQQLRKLLSTLPQLYHKITNGVYDYNPSFHQ